MPFVGDTFNRLYSWITDRNNGLKIQASRMDAEFDGIATGLSTLKAADSNSIKKDGSVAYTGAQSMGSQRITSLADATALTDALNKKAADKVVTTGGSSTAYTATSGYSLADGTVQDGTRITIRTHTASGTSPTLAVDTMTARAIKTSSGGTPPSSFLASGGIYELAFRSSDTSWYLLTDTAAGARIENDAVTYAKIQNVSAASRLLGRGSAAGSGDVEEITLGTGVAMVGTELTAGGVYQTLTASTSGTNIDFTGLASTVTEIQLVLNGVTTNGTNPVLIQLGTSGSFISSGYVASSVCVGRFTESSTSGFPLEKDLSTTEFSGVVFFRRMSASSNIWVSCHTLGAGSTLVVIGGGRVDLGATLTRLRVAAQGGDSFNAGSINVIAA